jgi:hypothetical protein
VQAELFHVGTWMARQMWQSWLSLFAISQRCLKSPWWSRP